MPFVSVVQLLEGRVRECGDVVGRLELDGCILIEQVVRSLDVLRLGLIARADGLGVSFCA